MPKHKCQSKDNCYKLIDEKMRYCDEHKSERFSKYNNKKSQDEFSKFYDKARWKKVRAIAISIRPMCKCGQPAEEVDHIIELRDLRHGVNDTLAYDLSNLNPTCAIDHRRKTEELKILRKQGKEALNDWYKQHKHDGITADICA